MKAWSGHSDAKDDHKEIEKWKRHKSNQNASTSFYGHLDTSHKSMNEKSQVYWVFVDR